jgi:hypothetical protein
MESLKYYIQEALKIKSGNNVHSADKNFLLNLDKKYLEDLKDFDNRRKIVEALKEWMSKDNFANDIFPKLDNSLIINLGLNWYIQFTRIKYSPTSKEEVVSIYIVKKVSNRFKEYNYMNGRIQEIGKDDGINYLLKYYSTHNGCWDAFVYDYNDDDKNLKDQPDKRQKVDNVTEIDIKDMVY